MLSLHVRKIKPGQEPRLRQWLAELGSRAEEVRETFRAEGVRQEQAFILATSDGPVVIWNAELDDPRAAASVFKNSKHPIDLEHADVLRECLAESVALTPLFDVALPAAG